MKRSVITGTLVSETPLVSTSDEYGIAEGLMSEIEVKPMRSFLSGTEVQQLVFTLLSAVPEDFPNDLGVKYNYGWEYKGEYKCAYLPPTPKCIGIESTRSVAPRFNCCTVAEPIWFVDVKLVSDHPDRLDLSYRKRSYVELWLDCLWAHTGCTGALVQFVGDEDRKGTGYYAYDTPDLRHANCDLLQIAAQVIRRSCEIQSAYLEESRTKGVKKDFEDWYVNDYTGVCYKAYGQLIQPE